ncbi:hypothetical protein [Variovorax paradoxus]|uniref:hypothetical protein n=1 Tax=Variovorax paradoxus TaxID=34073 RepID=UPI00277F602D|nr:hypothetical protein [Variovorax paradoxus]MDP9933496.1 hypothetical protein [Variovorax paradoxus]
MPINQESCESFYQGAFAEHHICSLFFLYGYEAQKVSPDVGIDLIVTNIARSRFKGEVPLRSEIQVKSVLLDASGAFASISAEELEFLSSGDHRYCVFVILHGLRGSCDPQSFERGDDPDAINAVDRDLQAFAEQLAATEGRARRRQGALSIHDFDHVELSRFWLHSSQMKRMREERVWRLRPNGLFGLRITLEGRSVIVGEIRLIPELNDIRYITANCSAGGKVRKGALSMDDY